MLRVFLAILLSFSVCAANAEDYFVDAEHGDDSNSGRSEQKAWATLWKVKNEDYKPGDRILFRAGTKYHGQLVLKDSGKAGKPIVVSSYGEGAKPHIEIGHTGSGRALGFLVTGTHDTQQEKCQYRDWKVSIDGTDIPVLGYTFAPAKTELKTKLGTSTEEAWNRFKKGLRLTVRAEQKCDSDFGKPRQMSLVFSLRGSNAAFRYVTADIDK